MKKNLFYLLLFAGMSVSVSAQVKIGDNPTVLTSPNSTTLELESTSKALIISRVNSVLDVGVPVNGMIVYVIADNKFKIYQNNSWTNLFN